MPRRSRPPLSGIEMPVRVCLLLLDVLSLEDTQSTALFHNAITPAGLRTYRHRAFLLAIASQPCIRSVLHDGGRSCLPLRGSSGFTPDSLFISGWQSREPLIASSLTQRRPRLSPLKFSNADRMGVRVCRTRTDMLLSQLHANAFALGIGNGK